MVPGSASDMLEEARGFIEKSSIENRRRLTIMLEIMELALPAIYTAAHHGNIRCQGAVFEIEKKLKQIPASKLTHQLPK